MLLKREHEPSDDGEPRFVGVEVRHTGIDAAQNFSTTLVAQAMAEGWMSIDGNVLTLHAANGDLRYTVKRTPGYYCCHNGAPMPISAAAYGDGALAAVEARQYLKANGFEGVASPDPNNPAGYERINWYECELDAAQHEALRARPGALAPSTQPVEV